MSECYLLNKCEEKEMSHILLPFKDEAQTALFKDPVRTAL
jgi:hypothetical protein